MKKTLKLIWNEITFSRLTYLFVILNFLDLLLTYIGIGKEFTEGNPLFAASANAGNFVPMIAMKIYVCVSLPIMFKWTIEHNPKSRNIIIAGFLLGNIIVGFLVVAWIHALLNS